MEKIEYKGWPHCVRLTNGQIELVVTTDVGPRVMRLAFVGGENEFAEFPDQLGKIGGEEWRIYGGHRLWHSPEVRPRTYSPDNAPVTAKWEGDVLRITQPTESGTGIEKEMEFRLAPDRPHVTVTHRLRNRGAWEITLAPWALSVMAPGGRAVVPQPTRADPQGLLPNRSVALWPYTNMQDPRVHWGERFILMRQDRQASAPIKIGHTASDGWAAYVRDGRAFVKRFDYQEGATYPDFGSSVECYTSAEFLELETLGPLKTLAPGAAVEHVERWDLLREVDARDEAAIERTLVPKVHALR